MVVPILLLLLTFYIGCAMFLRLLSWADSAPPEFPTVKGLCCCRVDPFAGVHGHCSHKAVRSPDLGGIGYVPRHAAA